MFSIEGYTKRKLNHQNGELTYHANPKIIDAEWYIFCMFEFNKETHLARIHRFFKNTTMGIPSNIQSKW